MGYAIFTIVLGSITLLALAALVYTYIGFPISLYFAAKKSGYSKPAADSDPPSVQVVISCYNEEAIIEERIRNALQVDYPPDKLSVLVISDGSTDGSNEIVENYRKRDPRVSLLCLRENAGKNAALNKAFEAGAYTGDLVCFTDSDTSFSTECIASAAQWFAAPKVGLVGGVVKYRLADRSAAQAEGAFWKLENFVRIMEGKIGLVVSCPGQFIMMRSQLILEIPLFANTDFAMPLNVLVQGHDTLIEPEAVIWTQFPEDEKVAYGRRHRTIIRAMSTIACYWSRSNPAVKYMLFWHKLARFWSICFQIAGLAGAAVMASATTNAFWIVLFGLQAAFYLYGIVGLLFARIGLKLPLAHLPIQFTIQHALAFRAFLSYLLGSRVSVWRPPR